jgi:two-component system, chemotaxis family, protein-glutamate methylesterase/glutaminase
MTPQKAKPIGVLIVDDSAVAREFLAHTVESDPGVRVVGTACNGKEALAWMERQKPDIVLMDIHMPVMNGLEATRRIMQTCPVPVIIVSSSWDKDDIEKTFQAMEAGAVAAMEKPAGLKNPATPLLAAELVRSVKLMAGMPLVRRWASTPVSARPASPPLPTPPLRPGKSTIQLVAIGASTGGPPVLQTLLAALSPRLSVPLVIVQHIAPGFLSGMADWLEKTTHYPVGIPKNGDPLLPGRAYLAPDGFHMGVRKEGTILLSDAPRENSLKPSVSFLFRSVAHEFGDRAAGVLLTGMGKDGAEELLSMRQAGAITIAQDKETSIVHGMPGEAIALGGACYIKPPLEIARLLMLSVNGS